MSTSSRSKLIGKLHSLTEVPLLIVGGGIHGAAAARFAAFNGVPTVLLERGDFSGATSSRSSKMIHGGLRYLEYFDIAQVREGVRARESLLRTAPHLVSRTPFFIPDGRLFQRLKLKAGLAFYDCFTPASSPRHKHHKREGVPGVLSGSSSGGFIYYDAITDDARLTIETVRSASQMGALCLNYVEVLGITRHSDTKLSVRWRSHEGMEGEISSQSVLNCAGPWFYELIGGSHAGIVRYSRGSHILFDKPWSGPALFLPLAEKGRYYFVWPHSDGTLVGTTEREIEAPSLNPQPSPEELTEILSRIRRDLPDSGLTKEIAHYAFAGERTLPIRNHHGSTAALSRRHIWLEQAGVHSLIGGKLTTAQKTAEEGVRKALARIGTYNRLSSISEELFPGGYDFQSRSESFIRRAGAADAPHDQIMRSLRLFGGEAAAFDGPADFTSVDGLFLAGALRYAAQREQVVTLEDLLQRRLMLNYHPGALDLRFESLTAHLEPLGFEVQRQDFDKWRESVSRIRSLLLSE